VDEQRDPSRKLTRQELRQKRSAEEWIALLRAEESPVLAFAASEQGMTLEQKRESVARRIRAAIDAYPELTPLPQSDALKIANLGLVGRNGTNWSQLHDGFRCTY